ncbi:hypothetical protein EVAR_38884_1 [Eumeta japonica]|uniref:Uncharacterized protein n=1 Tax=Eumeta variegata TaxID=151549 RepID=A0A4C1ZQF3_EUMVA|nr:hypothetical protein EVAR_38884_1 [Eumeta japonica]
MAQALGLFGFRKVSCMSAISIPYSDIQFVSSGIFFWSPFALNDNSFKFFGLRRPPKGGKLLHPGVDIYMDSKPISELETARRTAITVWMSLPNDEAPAVAVAEVAPGERGEWAPSAAPVRPSGADSFPTGWRRVRGRGGN